MINSTLSIYSFLFDCLFPRQCVGCKTHDTWFCDACFSLASKTRKRIERLPDSSLTKIIIASPYEGNPLLKQAINAFKFSRHPEDIGEKLGLLLAKTFLSEIKQNQKYVFVPIPLHKKREKERGFNQADILALHCVNHLQQHFPLLFEITRHLKKIRETDAQVNLPRGRRLNNLNNVFQCKVSLDPNHYYVLIDDIMTTGSTLKECAKTLKEKGAKKIWGLVVAKN